MRWLVIAVALAGGVSACSRKEVTPAGAEVLAWDASKSTHPGFAAVTLGPRREANAKATAPIAGNGRVELTIHVESADVTFVEDGKHQRQKAPVAVRVVVVDGGSSVIRDASCTGPDYAMPDADGGTAEAMLLHCHMSAFSPAGQSMLSFVVRGDAHVYPSFDDGLKIVD